MSKRIKKFSTHRAYKVESEIIENMKRVYRRCIDNQWDSDGLDRQFNIYSHEDIRWPKLPQYRQHAINQVRWVLRDLIWREHLEFAYEINGAWYAVHTPEYDALASEHVYPRTANKKSLWGVFVWIGTGIKFTKPSDVNQNAETPQWILDLDKRGDKIVEVNA